MPAWVSPACGLAAAAVEVWWRASPTAPAGVAAAAPAGAVGYLAAAAVSCQGTLLWALAH